MTGCDCGWCQPEMFDAGREFTPSEVEAIHLAMVREEQGRQSEERGE